jgi:hypothetical protein
MKWFLLLNMIGYDTILIVHYFSLWQQIRNQPFLLDEEHLNLNIQCICHLTSSNAYLFVVVKRENWGCNFEGGGNVHNFTIGLIK